MLSEMTEMQKKKAIKLRRGEKPIPLSVRRQKILTEMEWKAVVEVVVEVERIMMRMRVMRADQEMKWDIMLERQI